MAEELYWMLIPLITAATELLWNNNFAVFFIEAPLVQHQENTKKNLNLEK